MPPKKPRKPARKMTADEALEQVFGKRGAHHARKHAGKLPKKSAKRAITKKDK